MMVYGSFHLPQPGHGKPGVEPADGNAGTDTGRDLAGRQDVNMPVPEKGNVAVIRE